MIAILCLVAVVLLLLAEDFARRSNKRRVRYLEGWIHRHFKGSGTGDYELARADDHRGGIPVSGIEHVRGTR